MRFGIGEEREIVQERPFQGQWQKVAVGCWFTSTGKAIPKMIKYEDKDGVRHLLCDIHILKSEQRFYAGILSRRYQCSAVIDGMMKNFDLIYHPADNTWDMIPSN